MDACIDIYTHICLKPFSIGLKAMFKQQNPCSNHEIHVLFEHGFWPTSMVNAIETKWPTLKKLRVFSEFFTLFMLFV